MQFPYESLYPSRRSPVLADNVVATSQPLAAQAGLAMLARGGNAVDAALASAIALTVVEPTGNGLGSDAFCILWDGKELHGLNASGRAPAGWTPERFAGRGKMPERGWDSVTVPGAVSAWAELSRRFGRLDFATLFEPALGYAENGFPVSPIIAGKVVKGPADRMMASLGLEATALGVARHYADLADAILIDRQDAALEAFVEALGLRCISDDILMKNREDKLRLARFVVDCAALPASRRACA
mgnify:CR=1 FL=1